MPATTSIPNLLCFDELIAKYDGDYAWPDVDEVRHGMDEVLGKSRVRFTELSTNYRTSTEIAPWTLVESESKYYGRIKILQTVVQRLEAEL